MKLKTNKGRVTEKLNKTFRRALLAQRLDPGFDQFIHRTKFSAADFLADQEFGFRGNVDLHDVILLLSRVKDTGPAVTSAGLWGEVQFGMPLLFVTPHGTAAATAGTAAGASSESAAGTEAEYRTAGNDGSAGASVASVASTR